VIFSKQQSFGIVRKSLSKLYITFGLLVASTLIGVLGFTFIEDYTPLEAFFMTVITLSTVGFEEVHPLSNAGMIFTGFYIVFNLVIFAYVISSITAYLFEGELNKVFRFYMTTRELKKLNNHVIVCGFGRNGRKACEELLTDGKEFIVIDQNPDVYDSLTKTNKDIKILRGDATADDVLIHAGLERASTLITTLPSDADNVFISLTVRVLNPAVTIIARASNENSVSKLYRSGATHVIMPDNLGGLYMARLITKPYVIEFLELLSGSDAHFVLEEFNYKEFKDEYRDEKIRHLGIRENTGATIIAYKEKGLNFIFNPHSEVTISPNDIFILLGDENDLTAFRKKYIRT